VTLFGDNDSYYERLLLLFKNSGSQRLIVGNPQNKIMHNLVTHLLLSKYYHTEFVDTKVGASELPGVDFNKLSAISKKSPFSFTIFKLLGEFCKITVLNFANILGHSPKPFEKLLILFAQKCWWNRPMFEKHCSRSYSTKCFADLDKLILVCLKWFSFRLEQIFNTALATSKITLSSKRV